MFIRKRKLNTIAKLFTIQGKLNVDFAKTITDLHETIDALDGQIAQLWKEVAELKNVKASN